MELYDGIVRRKSCRSYTQQRFDDDQLERINTVIGGFEQLYPDVPLSYRFASETRGLFKVQAPHYLIVSGGGKAGESESAGFLFEQLVLWFDANNIGCVWLGKAKDANQKPDAKDIITIAFGQTDEPVHRDEADFRRKPMDEITNTPEDPRMRAIQLAPSGMNLQPWYFEKSGDKVLLYEQVLRPPVSLLYSKTAVDMGIALCHWALACKRESRPFAFERTNEGAPKKGYRLFGVLS